MVLELFNTQLYELYTARGHRLLGPCHDLELLPAGKFLYRGASVEDVFRLAQINIEEESITDSAIVFDNEFDDCFCIGNRDILQIKVDTSKRIRIENFLTPTNAHEAEKILNAPDSNWIASPELVRYFRSSKALAKIAVTRYSVAYSLLTEELKHDSEIIRTLCLESDLAYHGSLNSYFKEWNINPEDHLSASEVFILIESGRLRTD